jgi:hypothetical protein
MDSTPNSPKTANESGDLSGLDRSSVPHVVATTDVDPSSQPGRSEAEDLLIARRMTEGTSDGMGSQMFDFEYAA